MSLRFSVTLMMGAALAVSSLAHAKTAVNPTPQTGTASTPSTLSASGLADVQAIITYCVVVDPHSAAKYERLLSVVTSGHSSSEISIDQKSAAYRSELITIGAELLKIPASTGASTCKAAIVGL
jgi:hypothetical protein